MLKRIFFLQLIPLKHFPDDFFEICKIAATGFGVVDKVNSESMQRQVLLFCLHAAPVCVRLAHNSLRRLLCVFADTIQGANSHVLDCLASELLSATSAIDSRTWAKSLIPFYLMNRELTRGPELHSAFILRPLAPISAQDYAPSKLGPSILVALVSAAYVLPPDVDSACDPIVDILNSIVAQAESKGSEHSTIMNASGSMHSAASSSSIACASAQLQPARILAAARAAAAALMHFNRMTNIVAKQDANDSWLVGLAEKRGIERVCQHLERSGAVSSLISILQNSLADVGCKRSRVQSDSETDMTVWQQLVFRCNELSGACALDAEWL